MVARISLAVALLAMFSAAHAMKHVTDVESLAGRRLLASCTIGGKKFASCQKVKGGTVGFTKAGSVLAVGYIGGSTAGWAGWTVGEPHAGSSSVFNIQGAASTRTMNGQVAALITEPSKVKFAGVRAGKAGTKLWATFSLPMKTPKFEWAFAYGPYVNGLIRHAGEPKEYHA